MVSESTLLKAMFLFMWAGSTYQSGLYGFFFGGFLFLFVKRQIDINKKLGYNGKD